MAHEINSNRRNVRRMKKLIIFGTMLCGGIILVWSLIDEIKYRKRMKKK